jgi:hypothetical protein
MYTDCLSDHRVSWLDLGIKGNDFDILMMISSRILDGSLIFNKSFASRDRSIMGHFIHTITFHRYTGKAVTIFIQR